MVDKRKRKPPKAIKQRKDGRYCVYYKKKGFYGKTVEKACKKRDLYIKGVICRGNTIVKTYAEEWLPVAKASVTPKTYANYKKLIEQMNSVIGNKRASTVLPSDIKKIYSKYFLKASTSHIKHAKNLYASLFEAMKDDGIIQSNPVKSLSAQPHKGYSGTHRAITEEERYYIETTEHPLRPLLMAMLYAGLRNGEAIAMDIDRDIDFVGKVIHVTEFRHVNYNKATIDNKGKTGAAKRDVPLFPELEDALQGKHGLLASMKNGEPFSRSGWTSAWSSYVTEVETRMNGCRKRWYGKRKEDIQRQKEFERLTRIGKTEEAEKYRLSPWKSFTVRPYDLRHSFCAWCKDAGVEQHVLQSWMGHTTGKMILEVYDHVSPAREQQEAQKVRNLSGGKADLRILPSCTEINEREDSRLGMLFELVEKGALSADKAMSILREDSKRMSTA